MVRSPIDLDYEDDPLEWSDDEDDEFVIDPDITLKATK